MSFDLDGEGDVVGITKRQWYVFALFAVAFVMAALATVYAHLGETVLSVSTAFCSLLFTASIFRASMSSD